MHEFITFQIGTYVPYLDSLKGRYEIPHPTHEDTKISSLHVFREIIEIKSMSEQV